MSYLICPVCQANLSFSEKRAHCINGHQFDRARSGYFNLIRRNKSKSFLNADDKNQLRYRDVFLNAGWFDAVTDKFVKIIMPTLTQKTAKILDAGCGTGFYLKKIVEQIGDGKSRDIDSYAFDISKYAVDKTAKSLVNTTCFVADIWDDWPLSEKSMDLVINLFSPKSFAEASRVLKCNGLLVMAFPGGDHLIELRNEFGLMDVRAGKTAQYEEGASKFFESVRCEKLCWSATLTTNDIEAIVMMGPNGKRNPFSTTKPTFEMLTTFDIVIMTCRNPISHLSPKLS